LVDTGDKADNGSEGFPAIMGISRKMIGTKEDWNKIKSNTHPTSRRIKPPNGGFIYEVFLLFIGIYFKRSSIR
jgi:hypothetical protein